MPSSQKKQQGTDIIERMKDSLSVLGGATAIFVALLWYLGRQYERGYFESLNIPPSQMSLSIWEYGEASWSYFLFMIFIFVGLCFLFLPFAKGFTLPMAIFSTSSKMVKIIIILIYISTLLFLVYYPPIDIRIRSVLIQIVVATFILAVISNISSKSDNILLIVQAVTFIPLAISFSTTITHIAGAESGRKYITEQALSVSIAINHSIASVQPNSSMQSNNETIFVYNNLYLVQYNDKRYFLSSGITSECRPDHVYVIKEEDVRNVEYTSAPPLAPGCIPMTPTPVPPTPALTATPSLPTSTP